MIMNIYAKTGDKVVYLDENGYDSDTKYARLVGMKRGDMLTVKRTEVYDSSSNVEFLEYPNKTFNTVMFRDAYVEEITKQYLELPYSTRNDWSTPLYQKIAEVIEEWDIGCPRHYEGHRTSNASHIMMIYNAIKNMELHTGETVTIPKNIEHNGMQFKYISANYGTPQDIGLTLTKYGEK